MSTETKPSNAERDVNAAVTGAMLVADPEVTIPVIAVTHPKRSLGAMLLAYAVYIAMFGAVLFFVGFTRPIGRLVLAGALVMGLAGGYFLFHTSRAPPGAAKHTGAGI